MGRIPIMVKSKQCNLQRELIGQKGRPLNSNQRRQVLSHNGEDSNEMGGFFIVNGNEKLIRLLIVQRRNFPLAFVRDAYEQTAPIFTKYAISIRCCRPDQSSQTMTLHYLRNSDMIVRIAINRKSYFIPAVVLLKALRPTNDREIFEAMVLGHEEDTMMTEHVMAMLRANLTSQKGKDMPATVEEAVAAIGDSLGSDLDAVPGDNALIKGRRILNKYLLVHLDRDEDKWEYLVYVIRFLTGIFCLCWFGDERDERAILEQIPTALRTLFLHTTHRI
jgi:DNA-directed RNA polymerase I subunit RPA2